MKKTNVIITGASGFIGTGLLNNLSNKFNYLLILNNKKVDYGKRFKYLYSDLADFNKIKKKIVHFNPEICIHLAWQGIPNFDTKNSLTNIYTSINFLNFLIDNTKCKKIIVSGSCLEYGIKRGVCNEKNKTNFSHNSIFILAKQLIYNWLLLKSKEAKFDLVWLRLFYVYGPGQRDGSLIPTIIKNIKEKNIISFKTPYEFRDYIHIDDVSSCILKIMLMKNVSGIFNVGTGKSYCPIEMHNIIASHFKLDMFLKKININKYKRYKNKYNFKASILKSKRVLKWEPKKNMKKELVKLI